MKRPFFIISLVIFTIVGLTFIYQRQPSCPVKDRKLHVVCTTGMITDAVKNIAGDLIHLEGLMGPGIDPHLYKPRESVIHLLSQADLIIYNGLHLEGRMADLFEHMKSQVTTIAASEALDPKDLRMLDHHVYDPHIWFDVHLWIQVVTSLSDSLKKLDPVHATMYEQRTTIFIQKLNELDRYIRTQIARIPQERRILVSAHDAFGYFGKAYGLKVIGLQGINTDAEPSARDVDNLATFIVTNKLPAIFIESSIPQRSLIAVQQAVHAKGHTITFGGELYSDALGNPNTPEGTYLGMVRHNIDTIVKALQGSTTLVKPTEPTDHS